MTYLVRIDCMLPATMCHYQLLLASPYTCLPLVLSIEKPRASCDDRAGQEVFLWVKVFPPLWWEVEVMRFTFLRVFGTNKRRGINCWLEVMETTAEWTDHKKKVIYTNPEAVFQLYFELSSLHQHDQSTHLCTVLLTSYTCGSYVCGIVLFKYYFLD